MWNATLDSAIADAVPGIVKVTIVYTNDDGRSVTVTDRLSDPSSYIKIASDKIRELERIDAMAAFISSAPLGPIDFTPPALTPEQLTEQEYQDKRAELLGKKQDLDLGLIDQADYDSAVAATKTIASSLTAI